MESSSAITPSIHASDCFSNSYCLPSETPSFPSRQHIMRNPSSDIITIIITIIYFNLIIKINVLLVSLCLCVEVEWVLGGGEAELCLFGISIHWETSSLKVSYDRWERIWPYFSVEDFHFIHPACTSHNSIGQTLTKRYWKRYWKVAV